MNRLIGLLLLSITLSYAQPTSDKPFFSSAAAYVYGGTLSRSPDGKKTVQVVQVNDEDFTSTVRIATERRKSNKQVAFGLNAQLLWSPDSQAFALTGSDTGGNGKYRTDVFAFDEQQVRQISLTGLVQHAFGHPVTCEIPELPNVVAVKWLSPSSRLLVAAQVIKHTVCDSAGTFKTYEVDVQSRRIIRSHGQIESKKLFGNSLGNWLSSANDECITNPKSCEVPFHHRAGTSRR